MGAQCDIFGLIVSLNHDGMNDLAGVVKQEKYMVEGTERLDHDGMEANNRNASIRLTDMVHCHRVNHGLMSKYGCLDRSRESMIPSVSLIMAGLMIMSKNA